MRLLDKIRDIIPADRSKAFEAAQDYARNMMKNLEDFEAEVDYENEKNIDTIGGVCH